MINTHKDFNKYLLISILLILFIFIAIYSWKYINGFLGAFILFALFLPVHKYFITKLNINKNLSAIIIIIITLLLVIIPSYFIVTKSYTEITNLVSQRHILIEQIEDFEEKFPGINLSERIDNSIPSVTNWSADFLFKSINNIFTIMITLTIMYFLLFYLLVYHKEAYQFLEEFLPFSSKNSHILAQEFKTVTYATLITTGLVAILHGLLLGFAFWIFNIKGAVLWGLLAGILSFLPVVGTSIIWVPFTFYYLIRTDFTLVIGMIILGLIINYSEYLTRPYFQRKIGNLHPLVSIIGIFIGVSAFGFVGIVIGPLIISYFILTFRMFKEEYLDKKSSLYKK
jgi:predicted PurR-regulated permease PerM